MPKCRKRRICREPDYVIFQSENGLDDVTTLTVDEYEAIRQIDMEGLSQEECAKKMCVARTKMCIRDRSPHHGVLFYI